MIKVVRQLSSSCECLRISTRSSTHLVLNLPQVLVVHTFLAIWWRTRHYMACSRGDAKVSAPCSRGSYILFCSRLLVPPFPGSAGLAWLGSASASLLLGVGGALSGAPALVGRLVPPFLVPPPWVLVRGTLGTVHCVLSFSSTQARPDANWHCGSSH